ILADPQSDPQDVCQVCLLLPLSRLNCQRFRPVVVRRLTDPEAMVPTARVVRAVMTGSHRWQLVWGTEPLTLTQRAVACVFELAAARSNVRAASLMVLGGIGTEYHAPVVLPFLSDDSREVRRYAAAVLARIGGKLDLDAMDAALKADDP